VTVLFEPATREPAESQELARWLCSPERTPVTVLVTAPTAVVTVPTVVVALVTAALTLAAAGLGVVPADESDPGAEDFPDGAEESVPVSLGLPSPLPGSP
jgi:hypothetical protein